jgi:hypothetical protein
MLNKQGVARGVVAWSKQGASRRITKRTIMSNKQGKTREVATSNKQGATKRSSNIELTRSNKNNNVK